MAGTPEIKLTIQQYEMIYKYKDVDEIFWGGAAGGGKSEGLLMFALLRRLRCPGSVGIAFRKTYPELERSLIRKSKKYFHPFAEWKEAKKQWEFKKEYGGGIQEFGYIDQDRDVEKHQSAEYDDVQFDELGHFNEYPYVYMMSRLRPRQPPKGWKGEPWKGLMRSYGNPGGIGHQWIRDRFVYKGREEIYKDYDPEEGTYKTRLFIPAKLDDNTLMTPQARKEYRAWLNKLPDAEKRMLRDGDWEFTPGAAFQELSRESHGYNLADIPTPGWAPILMSFDFGYARPFSVGWHWIDYDGRMWRFAEWYGFDREKLMGIERERVINRPADPSVFAKKADYKGGGQGESVADIMAEAGVFLTPSDNNRLLGKQQFHERLRVPEDGERPMYMISNECTHFWRTLPSLPLDDKKPEDVDTDAEDHVYDESRYGMMSRPITPESRKPDDSPVQKVINRIIEPATRIEDLTEIHDL
jgi:hypothetical protein